MKRIIFVLIFSVSLFIFGCTYYNKSCDVFGNVSKELKKGYGAGENVRIAVLDSGIDTAAVDSEFVLNFCEEESAEDYIEHGSVVYNIIANEYYGLAPKATVYCLKVVNRYGNASTNAIVNALEWCLENSIDIINMSLSFGTYNENVECIVNELISNNVIIVASISNSKMANDFPAMYPGVICVGITDTPDNYSESYSIVLDKDSKVFLHSKDYAGNSFLTPVVTGIIACLINKTTEERGRTSEELVKSVKRFLLASKVNVV